MGDDVELGGDVEIGGDIESPVESQKERYLIIHMS